MAHVTTATPSLFNLGGLLPRLQQAMARRAVYVRTLRELQGLSNRDLADMGLHAGQIEEIAREAALRA